MEIGPLYSSRSVALARRALAWMALAAVGLGTGCNPFPTAPSASSPIPDMEGRWVGNRSEVVNQDSTYVSTLTIVIRPGMVSFTDSRRGQLPTTITSMDDYTVRFGMTDGLTHVDQVGVRTGTTLNGTETYSGTSQVAAVWAVTRQ